MRRPTTRNGGDRRPSGGFLFRIMPPSWHPVPAFCDNDLPQAEPFSFAATKIRIGRGTSLQQRRSGGLQAELFFLAATKIRIGRGALLQQGQAPLRRLFI